MKSNEYKQTIERVVNRCLAEQRQLLELDANERSITHKLAECIKEEFASYDVDCEYNRHGHYPKRLNLPKDEISWDDTEAKTVFPDIIIHKRGTDEFNLVVIEVKKSTNKSNYEFDKMKLDAFREELRYEIGLFLIVPTGSGDLGTPIFEWR